MAMAANMNRRNFSRTTREILSFVPCDLQIIAILIFTFSHISSSEGVSFALTATKTFLIKISAILVNLYDTMESNVTAKISAFVTMMLLILGNSAGKVAYVVWTALLTFVTASLPHVNAFVSNLGFMLTWSSSVLANALVKVSQLASNLTLEVFNEIQECFHSMTFDPRSWPDILWPISSTILLFWLSRPFDSTGKTHADHLADVLARKCLVSRDHDTAHIIRLAYLLGISTMLWIIFRSGHGYSTISTAILFVGALRLTINKQILTHLGLLRAIVKLKAFFREANVLHQRYVAVNIQQEIYIRELNETLWNANKFEQALRNSTHDLQRSNNVLNETVHQLQSQIHKLKTKKENEHTQEQIKMKSQIARLNNSYSRERERSAGLMSRMSIKENEVKRYRQQCATLFYEKNEVQLEIELLKCTSPVSIQAEPSALTDLAAPFVLVLIDGDPYTWSDLHFLQTRYAPGASAAQAIKVQVQNYLIAHKHEVPMQSRIAVRVFQNMQPEPTIRRSRAGDVFNQQPYNFPRDFTQSMPLFDYIDTGGGKERVDSKIQETAHLFISNPACHTIFLAVATDNGFARLLEQYALNDELRRKIVLVHPGYVIREIDALGFEAVEWPSVFQKKVMPSDSKLKAKRMAAAEAKAQHDRQIATTKMMIEIAPGLDVFSELVRPGVSGIFRKTGKEFAPSVSVEASVTTEDVRIAEEIDRVVQDQKVQDGGELSITSADALKEQIKQVCESPDQE